VPEQRLAAAHKDTAAAQPSALEAQFDEGGSAAHDARVPIAAGCLVAVTYTVRRDAAYPAALAAEPSVGLPPGALLEQRAAGAVGGAPGAAATDVWELSWRPTRDFLQPEYPACVRLSDDLGPRSNAALVPSVSGLPRVVVRPCQPAPATRHAPRAARRGDALSGRAGARRRTGA
jgi:hypothetical protein